MAVAPVPPGYSFASRSNRGLPSACLLSALSTQSPGLLLPKAPGKTSLAAPALLPGRTSVLPHCSPWQLPCVTLPSHNCIVMMSLRTQALGLLPFIPPHPTGLLPLPEHVVCVNTCPDHSGNTHLSRKQKQKTNPKPLLNFH